MDEQTQKPGRRYRRPQKTRMQKLKETIDKFGTLNIVLVLVFLLFLWFNWRMMEIYTTVGSIPETYACAVVAALLGECGVCGWIKHTKERNKEREWEKEDREEQNGG